MSELESLESQSHELIEGILKDWVSAAADATLNSPELTADEAVKRMQWLYLAEPWLIATQIINGLKLSGWVPPQGSIAVTYGEASDA